MNGIKLYKELSKRDYSGSESDSYTQLLRTLFLMSMKSYSQFLNLLTIKAKKLRLKKESLQNDEFTIDNISMS